MRRWSRTPPEANTEGEDFAYHQPAGPQGPQEVGRQEEDAGSEGQPAEAWRVHPRVHHHPQEAELGSA